MAGRLEEQPLDERVLVLPIRDREPLLLVVPVDEVQQDRARLPDHEVAVVVVDERRDASVRIVLGVLGCLVLALVEDEVDTFVGEAELFEDKCDFPVRGSRRQRVHGGYETSRQKSSTHQPLAPVTWVYKVNCLPCDIVFD